MLTGKNCTECTFDMAYCECHVTLEPNAYFEYNGKRQPLYLGCKDLDAGEVNAQIEGHNIFNSDELNALSKLDNIKFLSFVSLIGEH